MAGHAVMRAARTPAEEARASLSKEYRRQRESETAQMLFRAAAATHRNDTSRAVLEPTIAKAGDALQMLDEVRGSLEEMSGIQQVSGDPVKARASLALDISQMEGLLNSTDGAKWQPLLAPTLATARQAYKDLGVPAQAPAANATAANTTASAEAAAPVGTTAPTTEPPAMPYAVDATLDEDFPWDDGYLAQYENETSGDAAGSLPPPPGSEAQKALAEGSGASQAGNGPQSLPAAGAGPVALRHHASRERRHASPTGKNTVASNSTSDVNSAAGGNSTATSKGNTTATDVHVANASLADLGNRAQPRARERGFAGDTNLVKWGFVSAGLV